jgi:hypothetical protein
MISGRKEKEGSEERDSWGGGKKRARQPDKHSKIIIHSFRKIIL